AINVLFPLSIRVVLITVLAGCGAPPRLQEGIVSSGKITTSNLRRRFVVVTFAGQPGGIFRLLTLSAEWTIFESSPGDAGMEPG
ncbi:MAG: hypothetical protein V3U14_04220, partial [candidate division NC10 bacterium]